MNKDQIAVPLSLQENVLTSRHAAYQGDLTSCCISVCHIYDDMHRGISVLRWHHSEHHNFAGNFMVSSKLHALFMMPISPAYPFQCVYHSVQIFCAVILWWFTGTQTGP